MFTLTTATHDNFYNEKSNIPPNHVKYFQNLSCETYNDTNSVAVTKCIEKTQRCDKHDTRRQCVYTHVMTMHVKWSQFP